jgi:hypothetical protein
MNSSNTNGYGLFFYNYLQNVGLKPLIYDAICVSNSKVHDFSFAKKSWFIETMVPM